MNDIWNKRREILEKKVMDAGLELVDHAGAAAFELTIPGTSPDLKITLGTVRRAAPVVTDEMVERACAALMVSAEGALWPEGHAPEDRAVLRRMVRAALAAAQEAPDV